MATVLAAGQRYDRIIGVGGVSISTDGYLWSGESQITQPFPPRMTASGIAANGYGNVFVAISSAGHAATSADLMSWSDARLLDANFSALGITWSINGDGSRPLFCVAGSRKYNDGYVLPGEYEQNDQVAEIMINESGSIYTWDLAFTHPNTGSFFYNVRYFQNAQLYGTDSSVWVAVGQCNGEPEVWYTPTIAWVDGGAVPDPNTWQRVDMPTAFAGRPFYDVTQYAGTLYFSGRGIVAHTVDLAQPVWASSAHLTWGSGHDDLVSIAVNPDGHLVAVSSSAIWSSTDRVGWSAYHQMGYQFASTIWFQDHWLVGSYSNLTQYTYFTSSDGTTWTPRNNLLQAYGFCVY
jgi:hypothetical protein